MTIYVRPRFTDKEIDELLSVLRGIVVRNNYPVIEPLHEIEIEELTKFIDRVATLVEVARVKDRLRR